MRTFDEIDAILAKIPHPEWRERWCAADVCGCLGCANRVGLRYIETDKLTKEEHAFWKAQKAAHRPFIRKIEHVKAIQWHKHGDIPGARDRPAQIMIDRGGHYFYIDHADNTVPRPDCWLVLDPKDENLSVKTAGPVLHFSMYELKSGTTHRLAEKPELAERYRAFANWPHLPGDRGVYDIPKAVARGYILAPGDWIVFREGREPAHYSDKNFKKFFDPAP